MQVKPETVNDLVPHSSIDVALVPVVLEVRLQKPAVRTLLTHTRRRRTLEQGRAGTNMDSGGRAARAAVTRRPPISLSTSVALTEGCTYAAKVWAVFLVQGPFSVAPCQTLLKVQVNSRTHVPQKLTDLFFLHTSPVTMLSAPETSSAYGLFGVDRISRSPY